MALHLGRAGHDVCAVDAWEAARQRAQEAGLVLANDLGAALAGSDVLVSSLPDDAALLAVADVVVQAGHPKLAWVDTSTVSPQASRAAAERVARIGVEHLRATVSGNAPMAEKALLTVMASGPRALYDRLEPLLACWGSRRFYLGDGEQARLMKLVVNLMIAHTTAMLGEGLALGRKGGLDWRDMWQVITESAVASPIVKAKSVQLAERDFSPTFTVTQMRKDLGLIVGAAQALRVPLPLTQQVLSQQEDAAHAGFASEDYAAVLKIAERAAGLS
ncbi:NAD(P)-dependent oxidoreductase [Cupriavidus sp. TMH.W2]|uniref:NAD(P)-dependent oxidoreductase n=1 Tax=Cupriavidus sp. TMH.W2 TaxID=3434465 RepID=UPI003D785002